MRLANGDLAEHLYVLGGTGVGKSRALEGWALELMLSGQGVGFIDPHDESYRNLVARLATTAPHLAEQVVLFDPLYHASCVGFNPLELKQGELPERRASFLAIVIAKLFHADPMLTPRMQRLLFHAFWLLIRAQLTLLEFVPLLTDPEFRAHLLDAIAPTDALSNYWFREFPHQERLITEWTQSSLNKIGPLVTDPDMAMILGQRRSTIDFRTMLDGGKSLLVCLPKGRLGESNSYLLGAFILAQLQLAALSRSDAPYWRHRQWTLFIDEFQNYVTDDIHTILAESRKYRLSLVAAHQYYAQLSDQPKLQAAILNTVGNLAVFRIGATDAELFVKDLFTPPLDVIKDTRKRRMPTGVPWFPFAVEEEIVYRPLPEIWEGEIRRLTSLAQREFWYKRRGPAAPVKLRTRDMPDVTRTPHLEQAIERFVSQSNARYARPRAKVEQEIAQRQQAHWNVVSDLPPSR